VSIALRDPPDLAAGAGGIVARRAVVRWGWRLFRREWRQQLLVLSLLTVAVAGDDLGRQHRHERGAPEPELRHVRHRRRAGHAARHRPGPGRRHRRRRGPLGPGRSHRESERRYWQHPACATPGRAAERALQLAAAQPRQRHLPGRSRPGRADQPGRDPVRRARGRHLACRRHDLAGDRHRAEPEQPGG
jgi:hypothetical protein